MNKAAQEYRDRQVLNASPAERIVLAYDGAIRFLMAARRAVEEKNIEERYLNNKKAVNLISYLMETLDMERGGDIAVNLRRLYVFMLRRLIDVDLKNSVEPIDEVIPLLRNLRDTWARLANGEHLAGPSAPDTEADEDPLAAIKRSATA